MEVLRGHISHIYLSSVLQMLCNDRKTGVLRVWHDADEVKLFFDQGAVIYSVGSSRESRLGYLLRHMGLVDDSTLSRCLKAAQECGEPIGRVLVDRGIVSEMQLREVNDRKIAQALYDLFLWPAGEFVFDEHPVNAQGNILTQMDTLNIILDATHRADEMAEFRRVLPDASAVFRPLPWEYARAVAGLDPTGRRIAETIDGSRSITDLVALHAGDSHAVYHTLAHLLAHEAIMVCQPSHDGTSRSRCFLNDIVDVYHRALLAQCQAAGTQDTGAVERLLAYAAENLNRRYPRLFRDSAACSCLDDFIRSIKRSLQTTAEGDISSLLLINALDELILALQVRMRKETGAATTERVAAEIEAILAELAEYRQGKSPDIAILGYESTPSID